MAIVRFINVGPRDACWETDIANPTNNEIAAVALRASTVERWRITASFTRGRSEGIVQDITGAIVGTFKVHDTDQEDA